MLCQVAASGFGCAAASCIAGVQCLSVPWDDERRACRIESRRLRKVDLHTRLVAEYEAAMSEGAEEMRLSDGWEQEALSAMRVGASGELARIGRLEKALGLINACRARVRERGNHAGRGHRVGGN